MTRRLIPALATVAALLLLAVPARAQTHPAQVALVAPVQIFPATDTIVGVRLNLIYGQNAKMVGLDVGIANETIGLTKGLQYGVVNISGDFQGWQNGLVSITRGRFEGLQEGLVNVSDTFRGLQAGWVNHSMDAEGLQIALVNYAAQLKGIQIGLINIIKEGGMFPVFPIFNVGKKE